MSMDRGARGSSESEDEVAHALARLRGHEELWDEYRRAMTVQTTRYEEAAAGLGTGNYFVERGLAARVEVDSYVGRLAYQQAEYAEDALRAINAAVEAQSERPGRWGAGA